MSELERRDLLTEAGPVEQQYGECFIAIHMMDGNVQTINGIADTVTIKPSHDDYLSLSGGFESYVNGWDVTVHFIGNLVQEVKSMDGRVVDE